MSLTEVKRLLKFEKRARVKVRYLTILHFLEGKSKADIAVYLKVARGGMKTWVASYLNNGLDSLKDHSNPVRPVKLTPIQLQSLAKFVELNAIGDKGGRLQAKDVGEYIYNEFNVQYQRRNIYRLLHHLGFSWITSRSKHPKHNEEAQRLFKNLPTGNDP